MLILKYSFIDKELVNRKKGLVKIFIISLHKAYIYNNNNNNNNNKSYETKNSSIYKVFYIVAENQKIKFKTESLILKSVRSNIFYPRFRPQG